MNQVSKMSEVTPKKVNPWNIIGWLIIVAIVLIVIAVVVVVHHHGTPTTCPYGYFWAPIQNACEPW
jgi:hypothetical protein